MNLFELFIKIGVDDDASKKVASIAEKLGGGLKTAAKVGTAAVAVAGTAIAGLTTTAVKQFAEYEQLVGGAQLMFGDAYDFVAKKSAEAYKNVQMSQSQYLQQVNGFATGLKTALGGNAQAAAELADKIITAEADIVAATGASQEAVQNAFNGIMKSNFTMLDNLQLGITPTKEGFQELIDKVNEWNSTNGKMTDYQMGNLADMQSALVDYISMQGLAGYAANEGASTIAGATATMKAAWANLVTGIATSNAEIDVLLNNFFVSVKNVATNVIPVVQTVITNILTMLINNGPEMLKQGVNQLVNFINGLTNKLPDIIAFMGQMVVSMGKALLASAPQLLGAAAGLMGQLLSQIIQSAINIGVNLVEGVWKGIQSMYSEFKQKVKNFFKNIVDSVKSALGIHSPSRVFAEIGKNMALGLDVGWGDSIDSIKSDIMSDMDFGTATIKANTEYGSNGVFGGTGGKTVSVVQNIYSQAQTAADLMEEAIYNQEKAVLLGV